MPKTDPLPRAAAALLHAPPSPINATEPNSKQPKWNDTLDATRGCCGYAAKPQRWRALGADGADHGPAQGRPRRDHAHATH